MKKIFVKLCLLSSAFCTMCVMNAFAGYYETEITDICCDAGNEADCCASYSGYWCEKDKTCYQDINLDDFTFSPCMTKELCESREGYYGNDKYCNSNNTCYDAFNYYIKCPDVNTNENKCRGARQSISSSIVWCSSPAKCYQRNATYQTECQDDPDVKCNSGAPTYNWCYATSTCYGNVINFYYDCPDVDETYCKTKLGDTNHWCSQKNKCYYYTSTYRSQCK